MSFWEITNVLKPSFAKSEHASVIKSESIEAILGYITVSAPFKYKIVLFECLYFTMIPILLLSEVKGNMINMSNWNI